LKRLREAYGKFIFEENDIEFHAFPTLAELSQVSIADLRLLGFGYRAEYIA